MFQRQESLWRPCEVINPVIFFLWGGGEGKEKGKLNSLELRRSPRVGEPSVCVAKRSA